MSDTSHWSVDRRIPLALIFAIAVQTAGFAYWMGRLSVQVENNALGIARSINDQTRLTRLESQIEGMKSQLSRVDSRMERLLEKMQ